jgi:hypothetical protein
MSTVIHFFSFSIYIFRIVIEVWNFGRNVQQNKYHERSEVLTAVTRVRKVEVVPVLN